MQICFNLAYWITGHAGLAYMDSTFQIHAAIILIVQLSLGLFSDVYERIFTRDIKAEFKALLRNTVLIWVLSSAFILLTSIPTQTLVMVLTSGLFFDVNFFVRAWNKGRHLRKGLPKRNVIVVAAGNQVMAAVRGISENRTSADHLLAGVVLLDDCDPQDFSYLNVPVLPVHAPDLLEKLSRLWIDDAFILLDEGMDSPQQLMEDFLMMGLSVHLSFSVMDKLSSVKTDVQELGSYKVITSSINVVSDRSMMIKRFIDILGGIAGCILTGLIFLFIAPIIYIKSPGPIFFTQSRIGLNGRVFKMYKFRSMYMDAEKRKAELMAQNKIQGNLMFKMDDDPRIIGSEKKGKDGKPKGIGNFIRNTSLDEFPQFYNVLKGDMSLVGTRPPTLDEWNHYDPRHRVRMSARPGITGMWQVSGRSEITDFDEVVALDQKYIENWSLKLDFAILLKTVKTVLKHEGAV